MNSAYTFLETELIFVEKTHQKEIEECVYCLIDYLPSSYLLVVILVPAAISAPGIISSTPITTVLVDGNVIVVLVGFWIAISVIMPACPQGCETTSTW